MTTVEKLDQLLYYFISRRRVGHTKAMLRGAANTDQVIVLVGTETEKGYVRHYAPNAQLVTWYDLNLIGRKDPLVIDNHALTCLLEDVLNVIARLEEENKRLRKEKEPYTYRV